MFSNHMGKKTVIIVFILGAIVLVFGFFLFRGQNFFKGRKESAAVQNFRKAPEFALKNYDGNVVKLSDFKGTALVINVWASWCPFCREELSHFAKLKEGLDKNMIFVAINRGENLEIAKKYSDQLGITKSFTMLLDPSDSFYQSIGGFSMPETIFVDKEGYIRDHMRGPMNTEEMRARVLNLGQL